MTLLALDACGRFAIAALKRGGETFYASSQGGEGAVRAVYSSIDRVLSKADLAPTALDAIVVNTGPGSWTSTRVAVTYTASLAFGAGVRVFGYSGFAIGKRFDENGVAFIDQLGKTVAETDGAQPGFVVNLFAVDDAEAYHEARRPWLDAMLALGAAAMDEGRAGDPLELRTTYFQEFLTGARS
jgi:tRNA threonylcarbamoyl adenosine modification protein YeaZ